MGDTLKTAIQTKQDLYTNSYKITINWGTIQVLENVFYTKVSRIRRVTCSWEQMTRWMTLKDLMLEDARTQCSNRI